MRLLSTLAFALLLATSFGCGINPQPEPPGNSKGGDEPSTGEESAGGGFDSDSEGDAGEPGRGAEEPGMTDGDADADDAQSDADGDADTDAGEDEGGSPDLDAADEDALAAEDEG